MDKSLSYNREIINWGYLLGYLGLFLVLPPIIGLPVVLYMVWKKSHPKYSDYLLLMVCIAIYLGSINATKQPSGDQVNYYVAYMNVPLVGFIKSLIYIYGVGVFVEVTAALLGMVGDERMVKLIHNVAGGIFLLVRTVGCALLLFMLSISILAMTTGRGVV